MLFSHSIKKLQFTLLLCVVIIIGAACFVPVEKQVDVTSKVSEALAYTKQKGFSTQYCILIDMSVHSGKNRFVLWDFANNKAIVNCLVSHGCCNNSWSGDDSKNNPTFNNIPESHCSSLGKYKIGKRGWSNWGIHVNYLMHGLESTNSNALKRQIVFHSWDMVSDTEVYPAGTPEGWGCPAISNTNMKLVDAILKAQTKSVLMWIY